MNWNTPQRRTVLVPYVGLIALLGWNGMRARAASFEAISTTSLSNQSVSVFVPRTSISPTELAVIVNDSDPQSVAVANYYQQKRNIPDANMIHVSFSSGATDMTTGNFTALKAQVDAALPSGIQALAISWTLPWRVGCMSMTSAFAFGYTAGTACSDTCNYLTFVSYPLSTLKPFTDLAFRPAMMLAGANTQNVFNLIDLGVSSDQTLPNGDAYLLRTADAVRSVRYPDFFTTASQWNRPDGLTTLYLSSDSIQGKSNVLFYETGWATVPLYATNQYRPGAMADHLTSYGGILTGNSGQMSCLRWLEAGVTASYGTVVEPCNWTYKFPNTTLLFPSYFSGATALEAYWKSVQAPGEGLFVGEPLARPFKTSVQLQGSVLTIRTPALQTGAQYTLFGSNSLSGPFLPVLTNISVVSSSVKTVTVSPVAYAYYELAISSQAPDAVPLFAPTSPVFDHISTGSIRFSWAAGANTSGLTYVAQASTASDYSGTLLKLSGAALSQTFTGLSSQTKYYFRVQAASGPFLLAGSATTRTELPTASSGTVDSSGGSLLFMAASPILSISVAVPSGSFPNGTFVRGEAGAAGTSLTDLTGARSNEASITPMAAQAVFCISVGGTCLPSGGQQPAKPVRVSLAYDQTSLPTGQDERRLHLMRYDVAAGQWTLVPSEVDTSAHVLTAYTPHFSLFAPFFVAASGDLSSMQVFPQPWEIGDAASAYWAGVLTFSNLPASARVRIFAVTGELVWDGTASPGGVLTWDGNNRFGRKAASGTYFAAIESGGQRKIRRVVIIR